MDLFDLLTPEEKAKYAQMLVPTTRQTVGAGVGGIADAMSAYGHGVNNTDYMGGIQKKTDAGIETSRGYMDKQISENLRAELARRAAEKSNTESQAIGEDIGQLFPGTGGIPEETAGDKYKMAVLRASIQGKQISASKPSGRPKDYSYWWTAQRKGALGDERVKPFLKQGVGMKQAQQLLDSVKKGNTVAFAGLGIKMAKAMGEVGVMTEQDIKRYVNSKELSQSAADKLRSWTEGRPSEATQEEIQQIISALGDTYQKEIQPAYNEWIDSAEAISKGRGENLTRDDVAKRLALEGTVEGESSEMPDFDSMSLEELKKWNEEN